MTKPQTDSELGHLLNFKGPFQRAAADDALFILAGHFTARSMHGRFDDVVSIVRKHQAN